MTRLPIRGARAASIFAAFALVVASAVPASAMPDPETKAAASAKPAPLSRDERVRVWCVTRRNVESGATSKECKSRTAWIRAGRDPLGQY